MSVVKGPYATKLLGLVGSGHQRVKASSTVATTPSLLIVRPVAVVIKGGIVGTAYSETISTVGGTAPYTFVLTSGSLPSGLSLNSSTGVISGTPTVVATSTFSISATDANAVVGTQSFQISTSAASGINYGVF